MSNVTLSSETGGLYSGRGAALYDEVTRNDKSEIRELLSVIRGTQPRVLELAAGSGRLTIPLARVSREVIAVDSSKELLELLRERVAERPDLSVRALERDFLAPGFASGLDDGFDVVVLGTTTIALFDKSERESIFRASRALLLSGGRLLITLYESAADEPGEEQRLSNGKIGVREFCRDGLRHSVLTEYDGDEALGVYAGVTQDLEVAGLSQELVNAGFIVDDVMEISVCNAAPHAHHLIVATVKQRPLTAPAAEFFSPVTAWGTAEREAVSSRGSRVTFTDGTEALCMISGIWNSSLGYGNQAIAEAIHAANLNASTLPLFRRGSALATAAASRLIEFARPAEFSTVLFSTSGSAALDACVKLVRQFQTLLGYQRKARILSFSGSYHGMTMGAMAVTGENLNQDTYRIDQRLHIKIRHDDLDALERVMIRYGSEIAAVIVEPILGSGALPVPEEMVNAILRWRCKVGFLVVADEVATGYYRTGPRFASHAWPEQADIIVASKALTNGTCAASALLIAAGVISRFEESGATFWHGETQAGSPQSCAAIIATINEFQRLDAGGSSARVSERLDEFLSGLTSRFSQISQTGRGCFRAIGLVHSDASPLTGDQVSTLVSRCRDRGLLVQPGPSAIQLVPNLLMSDADLDRAFATLSSVLIEYLKDGI
jgi:hypothetical protein